MRIGLVTCAVLPEPDHDQELMLAAFRDAGVDVAMAPWDVPGSTDGFDLLIIRSTWNYYLDPVGFVAWLDGLTCPVLNPADMVKWNLDKSYLLRFESLGIPIVPSRIVPRGTVPTEPLWEDQKRVIKPCVSAGSWKTRVFEPGTGSEFLAELSAERDVIVQPFLTSVDTEGEHSLIWIDGEVRHTIRKSPRFDDQDECVSDCIPAPTEHLAFAQRVMEHVEGALYARIDIIRDNSEQLVLSELELIEPSLFFKQSPSSLPFLVQGAMKRLQS